MSFNMLAMLYMQAAQSQVKNRQAIPSKKQSTNIAKRKTSPTSIAHTDKAQLLKVKKKCRVCGRDGAISIFDNTGDKNIVRDITSIANVEIEKNDGLPSHICAACLGLLNDALIFKRRCEKMDKELRARNYEMEHSRIKKRKRLEKKEKFLEEESSSGDFVNGYISFFSNEKDTFSEDDQLPKVYEVEGGFVDCLKCCGCFYDKEDYIAHLPTCALASEKLLKEKQQIVVEDFRWLCDFCGKAFRQKNNLLGHRMRHTGELPFHCDLCPYRGRNREILNIHIRTHTGERPYKCPHCPRAFLNISNRNRHLTVHETRLHHTCSICGKGLTTARALHDHEQSVHHNVKAYECDICGKCLSTKHGLGKHRFKIHKVRAVFATVSQYLRIDEEEKEKQRIKAMMKLGDGSTKDDR